MGIGNVVICQPAGGLNFFNSDVHCISKFGFRPMFEFNLISISEKIVVITLFLLFLVTSGSHTMMCSESSPFGVSGNILPHPACIYVPSL